MPKERPRHANAPLLTPLTPAHHSSMHSKQIHSKQSFSGQRNIHESPSSTQAAQAGSAPAGLQQTCVHPGAQHSFLPPFILLNNEDSSLAKYPAKHSPWLKGDRASHSSMFQNASTATSTSALQPRETWLPPTPLSELQILFLLSDTVQRSGLTPRHLPQGDTTHTLPAHIRSKPLPHSLCRSTQSWAL